MTQIVCMFIIGFYIIFCFLDCKRTAKKIAQRSIALAEDQPADSSELPNVIHINESGRVVHQTIQLVLEKYEVERMKASISTQIVQLRKIDRKLSEHARRLVAIREKRDKKNETFWRIK